MTVGARKRGIKSRSKIKGFNLRGSGERHELPHPDASLPQHPDAEADFTCEIGSGANEDLEQSVGWMNEDFSVEEARESHKKLWAAKEVEDRDTVLGEYRAAVSKAGTDEEEMENCTNGYYVHLEPMFEALFETREKDPRPREFLFMAARARGCVDLRHVHWAIEAGDFTWQEVCDIAVTGLANPELAIQSGVLVAPIAEQFLAHRRFQDAHDLVSRWLDLPGVVARSNEEDNECDHETFWVLRNIQLIAAFRIENPDLVGEHPRYAKAFIWTSTVCDMPLQFDAEAGGADGETVTVEKEMPEDYAKNNYAGQRAAWWLFAEAMLAVTGGLIQWYEMDLEIMDGTLPATDAGVCESIDGTKDSRFTPMLDEELKLSKMDTPENNRYDGLFLVWPGLSCDLLPDGTEPYEICCGCVTQDNVQGNPRICWQSEGTWTEHGTGLCWFHHETFHMMEWAFHDQDFGRLCKTVDHPPLNPSCWPEEYADIRPTEWDFYEFAYKERMVCHPCFLTRYRYSPVHGRNMTAGVDVPVESQFDPKLYGVGDVLHAADGEAEVRILRDDEIEEDYEDTEGPPLAKSLPKILPLEPNSLFFASFTQDARVACVKVGPASPPGGGSLPSWLDLVTPDDVVKDYGEYHGECWTAYEAEDWAALTAIISSQYWGLNSVRLGLDDNFGQAAMMSLELAENVECSGEERLAILWLNLLIFNVPTGHEGFWEAAKKLKQFVASEDMVAWVEKLQSLECPFINDDGEWEAGEEEEDEEQ